MTAWTLSAIHSAGGIRGPGECCPRASFACQPWPTRGPHLSLSAKLASPREGSSLPPLSEQGIPDVPSRSPRRLALAPRADRRAAARRRSRSCSWRRTAGVRGTGGSSAGAVRVPWTTRGSRRPRVLSRSQREERRPEGGARHGAARPPAEAVAAHLGCLAAAGFRTPAATWPRSARPELSGSRRGRFGYVDNGAPTLRRGIAHGPSCRAAPTAARAARAHGRSRRSTPVAFRAQCDAGAAAAPWAKNRSCSCRGGRQHRLAGPAALARACASRAVPRRRRRIASTTRRRGPRARARRERPRPLASGATPPQYVVAARVLADAGLLLAAALSHDPRTVDASLAQTWRTRSG